MKRPRRPTKKTARKIARKSRKIKASQRAYVRPKLVADPYYINPRLIPAGWAYQWVPQGSKLAEGWTTVPYSRHAHDFSDEYSGMFGQITFLGLTLIETTIGQAQKEREALQAKARDLTSEIDKRFGRDVDGGRSGGFWIMPQDWNVSYTAEEIDRIDPPPSEGPPVEVAITLMMKVPARWNSAAAFLKLTLNEYARRRVLMERPVLGSMDPFSQDAVYEPVSLTFSPTKEV